MKALSVKQPWASLICSGVKNIENRTWKTSFRGRILIHSSSKPILSKDPADPFTCDQWEALSYDDEMQLFNPKNSMILGSVEIVDCVINHPSIWAEKPPWYGSNVPVSAGCKHMDNPEDSPIYNWVLKDPILFDKPIPCKGRLSLWEYPNFLLEAERPGLPF